MLATQIDHLGPEIPDYIPKILQSYQAIQATRQPSGPGPAEQNAVAKNPGS